MPCDYGGGVIPVPIPNTEVKPSYADDTAPLRGGKVGRRQAFFCLNQYRQLPYMPVQLSKVNIWTSLLVIAIWILTASAP